MSYYSSKYYCHLNKVIHVSNVIYLSSISDLNNIIILLSEVRIMRNTLLGK
jgi:hypothetical protein